MSFHWQQQNGINYAVATLGTATTPEHAELLFRNAPDVVFCFDGDAAGRQAAWRALENALPLAARRPRDEVHVPARRPRSGHAWWPTIGAEGFEARLKEALPLSQYLVDHLKVQVDLTHVDGRATLEGTGAAAVRQDARGGLPRAAGGPAGGGDPHAGRETQGTAAGRHHAAPKSAPAAPGTPAPRRRSRISVGRGNLLTQAIVLVLHHPAAAKDLPDPGLLAERRAARASGS